MIRMVAFDVDGTALDSSFTLREETAQAVKAVQDKGIRMVPFTGRSLLAMEDISKRMALADAVVCQNGTVIIHPITGQILYENLLMPDVCRQVIRCGQSIGMEPLIYYDRNVYGALDNEYVAVFEECMKTRVKYVPDILDWYPDKPVGKILFLDKFCKITELRSLLSRQVKGIHAACSYDYSLEISTGGKGEALKALCGLWDISMSEVMAVGDGESDIPLLEMAGFSVAMGNAMEKVKLCADHITSGNDENGFELVLKEHFLTNLE